VEDDILKQKRLKDIAKRNKKIVEIRERSLANMSDDDRALFFKRYDEKYLSNTSEISSIELSIFQNFERTGRISEKQLIVIVNAVKREKTIEMESMFYQDFVKGELEEIYHYKMLRKLH
jgi:hypothetical protein